MNGRSFKYTDIKEKLKTELSDMPAGACLENRNLLAQRYGVARTTLERAISELIGEGYLISREGSGTFVAPREEPAALPGRTERAPLWALLVSNILYDIYPPIVRAVEDVASDKGFSLIICNTDSLPHKQDEYVRKLMSTGVQGMVVVPAIGGEVCQPLWSEVFDRGISVVACVRPLGAYQTPGVYINSFQAGYLAGRHLVECGCRRIAYMSSALYSSSHERYQGLLTALQECGVPFDPELLTYEPGLHEADVGAQTALQLLAAHPDVDGIFAFNDRIAQGAVRAMARLGLTPGKHIKLVGSDDTDICQAMPVKLTSVGFGAYDMGQQAALALYELCMGRRPAQQHAVVGATLHVRNTTRYEEVPT